MLPFNPKDAFNPQPNPKTGQIDPYNLIATDRVRCMNCSRYFLTSEIQVHMLTHANVQFQQTTILPPLSGWDQITKPLTLDGTNYTNRSASTFDHYQPIDVRTMDPRELPESEFKRKEVYLPKPITTTRATMNHIPQHIRLDETRSHPVNQLTGVNVSANSIREQIQPGDYFEPVQLQRPQNVILTQIPVVLKRNLNLVTEFNRDSYVEQAKVPLQNDDSSSRKNTYTVRNFDPLQPKVNPSKDGFNNVSDGRKTIKKQIHVPEDRRMLQAQLPSRISTAIKVDPNDPTPITQLQNPVDSRRSSRVILKPRIPRIPAQRPRSFFPFFVCGDPESTLNQQTISEYIQTQHQHGSNKLNCACPYCGGFYCPVCKSTVPPQYRRPAPYIMNRDFHFPSEHSQNPLQQTRITNFGVTPTKSIM